MIEALEKLLRLADLRRDLAQTAVMRARETLKDRERERDQLYAALKALEQRQGQHATQLRSPMIGSAQLQGALAAVLQTFQGDERRLQAARDKIKAAENACTAASDDLEIARAALIETVRVQTKRRHLLEPLHEARRHAAELRDEYEAEDRRYGNTGGPW